MFESKKHRFRSISRPFRGPFHGFTSDNGHFWPWNDLFWNNTHHISLPKKNAKNRLTFEGRFVFLVEYTRNARSPVASIRWWVPIFFNAFRCRKGGFSFLDLPFLAFFGRHLFPWKRWLLADTQVEVSPLHRFCVTTSGPTEEGGGRREEVECIA